MQISRKVPSPKSRVRDAVIVLCTDEATRDTLAYWLSLVPAKAYIPADGYEATRILKANACTALITDRMLPPWPGLDTLMSLREAYPQLRIVVVDDGNPDTRPLARVTGAHAVLARPLARQGLFHALSVTVAA